MLDNFSNELQDSTASHLSLRGLYKLKYPIISKS